MSQNRRKMAKMLHNAAKKCDWDVTLCNSTRFELTVQDVETKVKTVNLT